MVPEKLYRNTLKQTENESPIQVCCQKKRSKNTWADYKRLRNEIASDLNLEKHNLLISEINLTRRRQLRLTLYGDVMSKATKVRKKIGSLMRDNI